MGRLNLLRLKISIETYVANINRVLELFEVQKKVMVSTYCDSDGGFWFFVDAC